MKRVTLLAAVLLMAGAIFASQQKKVDEQTTQWRYELQPAVGQAAEGSALVRVWTYSKNANIAVGQAAKNAVHGIIFKGYATSNDDSRIIGRDAIIADANIEAANAAYFEQFFATGGAYQRYVSEVNNGVPDQILKVGKEYKIGVTVVVMVDQLRKRLETDGIIAPANEVTGKMPTIMVVPSSVYCNNRKAIKTINENGSVTNVPDYEKALLENNDLVQAIAAINARLTKRGFEVKNLNSALATVKTEAREDAALKSIEYGEGVQETAIDVLRRVAKADIWIEIDWNENLVKGGSQKTLTFTMSAIDAYTDFFIGGVSPSTSRTEYASTFNAAVMIESAIQGQFEPFCNTLVTYFNTLVEKGRPIKMRVMMWKDFDETLMSEYDGYELHEIIEDWIADNTVKGKYGSPDVSPSGNRMTIEQIRMPLVNKKGRDQDPMRWARELRNMLNTDYGIESNLSSKGLGEVLLVIGSK